MNVRTSNVGKLILSAALAAPLAMAVIPGVANAQASFDLRIGTPPPPPPPRVLVAPPPRAGWVWVPGYWGWNGRRHVWYDGRWVRERRGYHYVAPEWRPDGDRYGFRRGRWERD